MHPSHVEWNQFYESFKRKTGLDLGLYKPQQMQRRILSMASAKGAKSLGEFWTMVQTERDGLAWFQDKLAINVSELFRNTDKFQELETKILPELLSRSPKLKIWSAGCSYGAEAHSVACILAKKFPGAHQVIGSDIDQAALAQAKAGYFNDADMRGVPNEYRSFFVKERNQWLATPPIKKYLTFRTGNLLADRFDSGFDLILCRNVVIYFTDEAKADLYAKFFQALKPGGILFVGSTERIFGAEQLGYAQARPFFYQKPVLGNPQWRNAS